MPPRTNHSKDPVKGATRKRKAHNKSRRGCRNCKLRGVKCDETRPRCTRCSQFGVDCHYGTATRDLQDGGGAVMMMMHQEAVLSPSGKTSHKSASPPALQFYIEPSHTAVTLDPKSRSRLDKFTKRTSVSISNLAGGQIYQTAAIDLAFDHPYLMHVVQVLTSVHDRYLSPSHNRRQTSCEIHHLSKSAALFNEKLSSNLQPSGLDAVWATAALLGILAFSWIDASTPEEAWPLAARKSSDLEWLRMSATKIAVFDLTNPLRADSAFRPMSVDYYDRYKSNLPPMFGIEGIPEPFVDLLELDTESTLDNNPYFAPMHTLANLLPIQCTRSNMMTFLCFISQFRPDFKLLLQHKDPRALVMLAYWYAKVCRGSWWIERRAVLECQAICLYLERYHDEKRMTLKLLAWPRQVCELARQLHPIGLGDGEDASTLDVPLYWIGGSGDEKVLDR